MQPVLKKLSFLYNPYVLTILTLGYLTAEMGHFLIGVTSKATATDTNYGDIACQYNLTEAHHFNITLFLACDAAHTEEECANLTLADGTRYCEFSHNGKGVDYQIIAGPSFIAVYSIVGIFFGILADKFNRVVLLAICFFIIGVSIALTGACTAFWQLLVLRMVLAVGEAGVNPLGAGILSDIFTEEKRALVLSLFNWGIYAGIGLSYPVGRYITELNLWDLSWRTTYYLTGLLSVIIAVFAGFTLIEPKRVVIGEEKEDEKPEENGLPPKEQEEEAKAGEWKAMLQPRVLMLFVAAAIRHTGGLCFTYNADLFYREVFPDWDLSWMLFFVTFVIGAVGVVFGGMISDKVVEKYGTKTRVAVLAVSQLISTPFAFGSIYMGPVGAMVTLAISYLFAEMWFGILFAILVEVVPLSIRSTTIGVFLFVMNMVGGNLPILVEPVRKGISFKFALAIFYAGAYLVSSLLFGLVLVMPGKRKKDKQLQLKTNLSGVENGGFTTIEKIASPPYANGGGENGYPYESHHL